MVKFYATTAIPYVNARPHLGHALEYVQADVIRRYHRLIGDEVHLVSGADENALKNVQAAEKAGVEVKTFLERNSDIFRKFYADLGVGEGPTKNFIGQEFKSCGKDVISPAIFIKKLIRVCIASDASSFICRKIWLTASARLI